MWDPSSDDCCVLALLRLMYQKMRRTEAVHADVANHKASVNASYEHIEVLANGKFGEILQPPSQVMAVANSGSSSLQDDIKNALLLKEAMIRYLGLRTYFSDEITRSITMEFSFEGFGGPVGYMIYHVVDQTLGVLGRFPTRQPPFTDNPRELARCSWLVGRNTNLGVLQPWGEKVLFHPCTGWWATQEPSDFNPGYITYSDDVSGRGCRVLMNGDSEIILLGCDSILFRMPEVALPKMITHGPLHILIEQQDPIDRGQSGMDGSKEAKADQPEEAQEEEGKYDGDDEEETELIEGMRNHQLSQEGDTQEDSDAEVAGGGPLVQFESALLAFGNTFGAIESEGFASSSPQTVPTFGHSALGTPESVSSLGEVHGLQQTVEVSGGGPLVQFESALLAFGNAFGAIESEGFASSSPQTLSTFENSSLGTPESVASLGEVHGLQQIAPTPLRAALSLPHGQAQLRSNRSRGRPSQGHAEEHLDRRASSEGKATNAMRESQSQAEYERLQWQSAATDSEVKVGRVAKVSKPIAVSPLCQPFWRRQKTYDEAGPRMQAAASRSEVAGDHCLADVRLKDRCHALRRRVSERGAQSSSTLSMNLPLTRHTDQRDVAVQTISGSVDDARPQGNSLVRGAPNDAGANHLVDAPRLRAFLHAMDWQLRATNKRISYLSGKACELRASRDALTNDTQNLQMHVDHMRSNLSRRKQEDKEIKTQNRQLQRRIAELEARIGNRATAADDGDDVSSSESSENSTSGIGL